jgi:hypothetical protein
VARPARGQRRGQLDPGQRGLAEQARRDRGQFGQVDSGQVPAEVTGQGAFHQGLVQRAEADEILGADQVDGVAHQMGAYHRPFGKYLFQMVRTESGEPRPQPHVRGQRRLGLHPGQVRDRLAGGQRGPAQQQLALQRGAVQRAQAQAVGGHARAAAVASSAG